MKSHLTDLDMILHHETGWAVFVSLTGKRADAVWLPKQAIEIEPLRGFTKVRITLPEQLATDKGLV